MRCATINPARVIGEEMNRGSLMSGKIADIVLLGRDDLRVKTVIKYGKVLG